MEITGKNSLTITRPTNTVELVAQKNNMTVQGIDIYTYLTFIAPWQFVENNVEVT